MLVNNAGGQFSTPAEMLSPKGWDAVIRNNLNGTFYMTREVAVASMIPQQRGRIVNIIANIARGFPGMVHTGAARAGVDNMTKTLAVEWAQHGIAVNAIAPGVIRSSGTERYPPELLEMGRRSTPAEAPRHVRGGGRAVRLPRQRRRVVRHGRDVVHRRRRPPLGRHLDRPRPRGARSPRGRPQSLPLKP